MKKIFLKYFLILGAVIFVSSCTKDKNMYEINQATAPSSGITLVSSTTNIQGMSLATQGDTAVNFSWGPVWYGTKTPVTYTLQYDSVGKNFANPIAYSFGQDLFQGSITQSILSQLGVNAGMPKGVTGTLEFRIMASIGTENQLPVYSNVINISFNTYVPLVFWYVPGEYQGWSPSTAPKLWSTDNVNFEGYVYVPGNGSSYQYKFTAYPDWNHTDYGLVTTAPTASGTLKYGNDNNIQWPFSTADLYKINVNASTLAFTTSAITWGVIGDFNGWGGDVPMTYDAATNTLKATVNFTGSGFKFRANGAWDINLGGTNTSTPLSYGGGNLPAPTGTHIVTLDLFNNVPNYTYSIQ